jgi:hypothetical protein
MFRYAMFLNSTPCFIAESGLLQSPLTAKKQRDADE